MFKWSSMLYFRPNLRTGPTRVTQKQSSRPPLTYDLFQTYHIRLKNPIHISTSYNTLPTHDHVSQNHLRVPSEE